MPQPKSSSGRSGSTRKTTSTARKSGSPSRSGGKRKPSQAKRASAARSTAKKKSAPKRKSPARRKPAAKKQPAARRSAAQISRADQIREALGAPLDIVVLTRDRVQEVADEAVERGRITRGDAEDLVRDLVRSARSQTEDIVAQLEALLDRGRGEIETRTADARKRAESAAGRATKAPQVDRVAREVDRARRAVGVGPSFPILRYDDLTAGQVGDRLTDLSPAELRKVRDYERRNANRKSVLDAIEKKLG